MIRFDNRDAGLSTQIDAPVPNLTRAFAGLRIEAPYLLRDMANDTFGLLDHLEIGRPTSWSASMGGMIAQTMAIERPERVLSLTSIMSTTGNRRIGRPRLRVMGVLMRQAPREEAYVDHFGRVFRMIGSKRYPVDEQACAELAMATTASTAAPARAASSQRSSPPGDRTPQLRRLDVHHRLQARRPAGPLPRRPRDGGAISPAPA